MTRDDIIRMAREADAEHNNVVVTPFLARFAALVAAHERAALAEPEVEQEPADDVWFEDRNGACRKSPKDCQRLGANGVPEAVWVNGKRYTSGEWQGLTDEEIEAAWKSCDPKKLLPSFAAAIEVALKERNT